MAEEPSFMIFASEADRFHGDPDALALLVVVRANKLTKAVESVPVAILAMRWRVPVEQLQAAAFRLIAANVVDAADLDGRPMHAIETA